MYTRVCIFFQGNIETLKNCCVQMLDALKSVDKTVDKAVVEGFKKLLHEFLQGKRYVFLVC